MSPLTHWVGMMWMILGLFLIIGGWITLVTMWKKSDKD